MQATTDLFPAPGSPGLRGLFGQKRKRGFSKVEEEPKKAGQTCKEQIPARCRRPRNLERSQRIYPNSSRRGLTVCVPGGERPRLLLLATQGAGGLGTGQWGWGSEGLESLLVYGGAGGPRTRGLGHPVLLGGGG